MVVVIKVIYTLSALVTFMGYVVELIKWIRCRKKKNCKNDTCPIRTYCNRIAMSDKEMLRVREIIKGLEYKGY